nr:MAG TPA: hypothetical protein [Caudoviricetes sp.]
MIASIFITSLVDSKTIISLAKTFVNSFLLIISTFLLILIFKCDMIKT